MTFGFVSEKILRHSCCATSSRKWWLKFLKARVSIDMAIDGERWL